LNSARAGRVIVEGDSLVSPGVADKLPAIIAEIPLYSVIVGRAGKVVVVDMKVARMIIELNATRSVSAY